MSESNSRSGISILGLLGVAFVVLKLCGVINWSWWYVTMPFWIGLPIVISVFIIIALVLSVSQSRKKVVWRKK